MFLAYGIDFSEIVKPLPVDSPWRRVIAHAGPLLYGLKLFWWWVIGSFWAFEVRGWLLSVWPSIEFDFVLPHLKTEGMKKRRLLAVATLVVIPLARSIIYDVMRSK